MVQKGNPKQPKKLDASMAPKEWQEQIKARALAQDVSEHDVIIHGLHFDFVKERDEKDAKSELKAIQKENEKTLKSILKELKKGGKP